MPGFHTPRRTWKSLVRWVSQTDRRTRNGEQSLPTGKALEAVAGRRFLRKSPGKLRFVRQDFQAGNRRGGLPIAVTLQRSLGQRARRNLRNLALKPLRQFERN